MPAVTPSTPAQSPTWISSPPGIVAQSVLFVAIFYGIHVIGERDLGLCQRLLASPDPRGARILGKGVAAGIRSLSQAIVVYILALFVGVKLDWNPLARVALGARLYPRLGTYDPPRFALAGITRFTPLGKGASSLG